MNDYLATYWLINGKAYPDTAPISCAGRRPGVLLRYLNAGYDNTSMSLLGMHQRVLARDAHLLNNPFLAAAETIPAGATEDAIATIPSRRRRARTGSRSSTATCTSPTAHRTDPPRHLLRAGGMTDLHPPMSRRIRRLGGAVAAPTGPRKARLLGALSAPGSSLPACSLPVLSGSGRDGGCRRAGAGARAAGRRRGRTGAPRAASGSRSSRSAATAAWSIFASWQSIPTRRRSFTSRHTRPRWSTRRAARSSTIC